MKLLEAIAQLKNLRLHEYDDETVTRWISDLDGRIFSEVLTWHEGAENIPHGPYSLEADRGTELLVKEPYSDLYIKYLMAQVDFYNAEPERYANSMVMYNAALSDFADSFNRTHMPKSAAVGGL